MRPARIIALLAALVAAFVVSGPAVAGSDSPTPNTVAAQGITFPRPLAAHDHVNVRLTDGTSRGLHLDPNNGHPGGAWIAASFLPWSALGITGGCISWNPPTSGCSRRRKNPVAAKCRSSLMS